MKQKQINALWIVSTMLTWIGNLVLILNMITNLKLPDHVRKLIARMNLIMAAVMIFATVKKEHIRQQQN